jgi:hypothetical protein
VIDADAGDGLVFYPITTRARSFRGAWQQQASRRRLSAVLHAAEEVDMHEDQQCFKERHAGMGAYFGGVYCLGSLGCGPRRCHRQCATAVVETSKPHCTCLHLHPKFTAFFISYASLER